MPIDAQYQRQVQLLMQVPPRVAEEECVALKGGTAINFFMRGLPRLSVGIDLTFLPLHARAGAGRDQCCHETHRRRYSIRDFGRTCGGHRSRRRCSQADRFNTRRAGQSRNLARLYEAIETGAAHLKDLRDLAPLRSNPRRSPQRQ